MTNPNEYPILEFDPEKRAVIEPSQIYKHLGITEYCVICFFRAVVEDIARRFGADVIFEEKGVYGTGNFYRLRHEGQSIVFFHPFVGAPIASAFLEVAIALGCKKFIVSGGAGVLDRDIPVGGFIVPSAAVRDEGVSYHYAPPGREIAANPKAVEAIRSTLDGHGETYRIGKVWTTDAFFRETASKVQRRKKEGCIAVEMEAAGLFAVSAFRGVDLGYILYGGDDVSGAEWDERSGKPRIPIAEKLFWLSVEACLKL